MLRQLSFIRASLIKVCLIILSFFYFFPLLSQQYEFENFTLANGLPQATLFRIFQDSRGYLWLGTEGSGACRFDGKDFKVFNTEAGMAGNVVRDILEDSDGRLWFATDAGVSVYDGISFTTIDESKGLSGNTIVCLFRDSKNSIWIGTSGDKGGLNKTELLPDDSVRNIKFTIENGLPDNNVFSICEDNLKRLWVGTFGGGIAVLNENDTDKYQFRRIPGIGSNHILTLTMDSEQNIWAGTYDKGVLKITVASDLINCRAEESGSILNLPDKTIWSVLDNEGETWIGTNENGIQRIKNSIITPILNSNGLLTNQVTSLFRDREKNIWIASADGGLSRYLGDKFYSLTKKEGLSDENAYSIAITSTGDAWIGTYGGGLFRIDTEQPPYFVRHFTVEDGLPDNIINSLSIDRNENLWIATPKGIAKYDGKKFRVFNEEKDGLVNDYVNTVFAARDNIIWCGTKNGISIYDGKGFRNTKANYLPNAEVQTIIQDRNSNIWCGTLGGLAKFHDDKLTTFDEAEGLTNKKVHCLAEDRDGNIWIGTFGSGIFFLPSGVSEEVRIRQVLTDSLLNSPNIYSLVFADDSTLLAGTDMGMNRIMLDKNLNVRKVIKYSLKDGFRGIKNNINAVARNDGEIWFGTPNGISIYRPGADIINNIRPKVHITDVRLFFNEVDWKKENYNIRPFTNLPENLILKYFNNHLTFKFTGLFFCDKEEIRYQYRLEGLENEWSPPRSENEAVYPGLAPGDYIFLVTALDRFGNRSDETAEFSFTINPPFWKTTWFLLICVMLAVTILILYIKYRERKLRIERDRLEKTVKERTAEVVRQKEQIEIQRDEIQIQHNIVSEQKKDIMDSIQYAKRIQTAAIPSEEEVSGELKELFILYKPRDVVSGDFYWLGMEDGRIIVIAADCTGHGVPGAFTSMLGISMLNDIIGKESTTSPEIILNELRKNIITSLKQSADGESKDGMDIAILTIDKQTGILDFAGAMNPLFVIRESGREKINDSFIEENNFRLYEIKGDKMPAAIHIKMEPFKKTSIRIEPGDEFYVFSDGYEDQFGGSKPSKFMRKNFKNLLLKIHDKPMQEQKAILEKTIIDWSGDLPQVDDILVIGFRVI